MIKKTFAVLLTICTSFLLVQNVEASTTKHNINLYMNGKSEVLSIDKTRQFDINFTSSSNKIEIINDGKLIKTITLTSSSSFNTITFDLADMVNISSRDDRDFYFERNQILNTFKFEITNNSVTLKKNNQDYINADGSFEVIFVLTSQPALSGKDAIVNNIEKPYTLEEIQSSIGLVAYDEYDGDITKKIVVDKDNYTANKSILGEHTIIFSVTNSSRIKTTYEFTVINKDFNAPVITGPSEKTYSYKENITIDSLKGLFTVSDNYDKTVDLNVESNNFKSNTVGVYNFKFFATDISGNKGTKDFKLTIIDDVNPKIVDSNNGVITINYKDVITTDKLLLGLTANDEIDGNITSNIKVIENTIGKELKEYKVTYEVNDKAGNKTQYERTYKVISLDIPSFYISNNILSIEDVNKMTIDQLAELLSEISNVKMKSFEVIKNEYEGNENNTGTYKLSLKITDDNDIEHYITRDINVFSKTDTTNNSKLIISTIIVSSISLLTVVGVVIYKKRK